MKRFDSPFALIKRQNEDGVLFFSGSVHQLDLLEEIPRKKHTPDGGVHYDTLSIIPYRQITEKGYRVHDDGRKIMSMQIEESYMITYEELLTILPDEKILLGSELQYAETDEDYRCSIRSIINDEIGNGEGCNFLISRKGSIAIKDFSASSALSIFRNLITGEVGSYWTFIFFDGTDFILGATPEKHISYDHGRVKMNPISGTFRKKADYPVSSEFRREFLKFLTDEKEINELFMVVDEELKMMAKICSRGGMIVGPLLKEMSKLIHTEYFLCGESSRDIIDVLRESLFAATVVGGPLENAAEIIYKYEQEGRGCYSGLIALIGRNDGGEFLDSPICIRTVELSSNGKAVFRVGATLVRNSDPQSELEEAKSKIGGLLNSIVNPRKTAPVRMLDRFRNDEDIAELLQMRNQHLSKFWFFSQTGMHTEIPGLLGKKAVIMDNQDDFCYMTKHILVKMGISVEVVRFSDFDPKRYSRHDLFIIGPGVGDPNNMKNPKMKLMFDVTADLIKKQKKFLSICLGHQILCRVLGIDVIKKTETFQGVPQIIDLFGVNEIAGFYNTFAGQHRKGLENEKNIAVSYDKKSGEIHAIKDANLNFIGFQFHAESILTQNGYDILRDALLELLK